MVEKAAVAPTEDAIEEEEGDDTTLETSGEEHPAEDAELEQASEKGAGSEEKKGFSCCEPELIKNLQAAVGFGP